APAIRRSRLDYIGWTRSRVACIGTPGSAESGCADPSALADRPSRVARRQCRGDERICRSACFVDRDVLLRENELHVRRIERTGRLLSAHGPCRPAGGGWNYF